MVVLEFGSIGSVNDVLQAIDNGGLGYVAIVNNGYFVGLITDGDLRRGLLNGISPTEMINRFPSVHVLQQGESEIPKGLHRPAKIKALPILDAANKLVDVIDDSYLDPLKLETMVIVMAGGLGTRLGELTKNKPKPMIPVAGKPMLESVIENFKSHGFFKFVISLNYLGEQIEEYFGDGSKLNVEISYVKEEVKLGTAGSLSLMPHLITSESVIVANADVISSVSFRHFLNSHLVLSSNATVLVREIENEIPYGVVTVGDGNLFKKIDEKPRVKYDINTGIYALKSNMLSLVPFNKQMDMPHLINLIHETYGNVRVYRTDSYWVDLGRSVDLENHRQVLESNV